MVPHGWVPPFPSHTFTLSSLISADMNANEASLLSARPQLTSLNFPASPQAPFTFSVSCCTYLVVFLLPLVPSFSHLPHMHSSLIQHTKHVCIHIDGFRTAKAQRGEKKKKKEKKLGWVIALHSLSPVSAPLQEQRSAESPELNGVSIGSMRKLLFSIAKGPLI